jgi:IclR family transcriptional regulator, KDG regulon repressor
VETSDKNDPNQIQSVLKALDVLECLATAEAPLSVRTVAEQCGFSRPTVYRLLNTLAGRDYVRSTDEGRYAVGTRVLMLGKSLLDRLDLPELARADLRALSRFAQETVHLSILDGTDILYLDKAEPFQSVHMYCMVGTRNPLYCTSMGKAILAFLPREQCDAILSQTELVRYTPTTIVDPAMLCEHLQVVRERGYAIDNEEKEKNIRCVGAPVFDHLGQAVAAISISGPAYRMLDARLQELAGPLTQTAEAISRKLGYVARSTPMVYRKEPQ